MNRIFLIVAVLLAQSARADSAGDQQFLPVVRGFYAWALQNGKATQALEPKIRQVPASTRLFLDTATLPAFTSRLMKSGQFAPAFESAVERYYAKQRAMLEGMTPQQFDQMASDGRGPLMDTEDMDLFFCAQEYRYTKKFVQRMRVKSWNATGSAASAVVVSPLGWETRFQFDRIGNRWLIAGYCVYE